MTAEDARREAERCDLLAEEIEHLRNDLTIVDRQLAAERAKSEGLLVVLARHLKHARIARDAGKPWAESAVVALEYLDNEIAKAALCASPSPTLRDEG